MIVCPFRPPGKDHEKHADDGTQKDEEQNADAMAPTFDDTRAAVFRIPLWR